MPNLFDESLPDCSVKGCEWKAYPDTGKCWPHSLEDVGKSHLRGVAGPPDLEEGRTFQKVLDYVEKHHEES